MTPTDEQTYIHERVMVAPDGCWIWLNFIDKYGYGRVTRRVDGVVRCTTAHRYAYLAFRGEVPEGLELDHLVCDERACCNPWHVEPRTSAQNVLRSPISPAGINARKTHCDKGHEFTPSNTYMNPRSDRPGAKPFRACRTCARNYATAKRAAAVT